MTTATFTADGTFNVPAGVTSALIETWGGGGPSSGHFSGGTGRGGGGGAYAADTVALTPGEALAVVVGNGGTAGIASNTGNGIIGPDTSVKRGGTTLVLAASGGPGLAPGGGGTAGAGGTTAASTGSTKWAGGSGGATTFGSGGGSAGSTGPGGTGTNGVGGIAGTGTNGTAGSNRDGTAPIPGNPVGGGAGGHTGAATTAGAIGGRGEVRITYSDGIARAISLPAGVSIVPGTTPVSTAAVVG